MFEDLLGKKTHKKSGCEVEICPQCMSSDIDVYPTSVCDVAFYYVCCNHCGFRWTT